MRTKKKIKKDPKITLNFEIKVSTSFFAYDTQQENRAAIKALLAEVKARVEDEFNYMSLNNEFDCADKAKTSVKLAKTSRS